MFLLRGLIIGLAIAAPIGPIGALCIGRTLVVGRTAGFVTGLGAVTVHALYGGLAIGGLTGLATVLVAQQSWLHPLVGGALCWLGLRTWRAPTAAHAHAHATLRLLPAYASATLLALANPFTILAFAALFAGAGLTGTHGNAGNAGLLLVGDLLGATLWWALLSGGTSQLRRFVTARRLAWVNRASGATIGLFGLLAVATVAW